MKKILVLILGLSAAAFSQTYNKSIRGNIGDGIFLFGSSPNSEPAPGALINLDTLESDTSKYVYDLIGKPIVSLTDTVGFLHFTCKDSTGTDTVAARVFWQGNMRSDGKGTWAAIDSLTLKDLAASGAAGNGVFTNATPAPVVNSKGYLAMRFIIKNYLNANVNRKCVCKDVMLNRRQRLGPVSIQ